MEGEESIAFAIREGKEVLRNLARKGIKEKVISIPIAQGSTEVESLQLKSSKQGGSREDFRTPPGN